MGDRRGSLTGTGALLRHALRRDRIMLAIWILVLDGLVVVSALATRDLYPDPAMRRMAVEAINSTPAIVALYGPIVNVASQGDLAMTKMTVLYAVFLAVLMIVLVRRHTRIDEETGRAELLGGTAIGRDAPYSAAIALAAGVSVAIGLLAGLGNIASGLPVQGSLLFGASWTGTGLVSAAWTLVCCQVFASARSCAGLASIGVGVAYLARAVGDVRQDALRWVSPFGWNTQLHAWSDSPRWWVLGLYVVTAGALFALATGLRSRRDLGAGVLMSRGSRSRAALRPVGVVSLAVRQHLPMLLGWMIGFAAMGAVMGSIAPDIGRFLDSPQAQAMMEKLGGRGAFQDVLLAAELSIMAVVVCCFGISVLVHAGADEQAGRTELLLATGTSRVRQWAAGLTVALAGSLLLLLTTGLAVGVGFGRQAAGLAGAALAYTPAVWTVVGLTALLLAIRSRWAPLGWGVLVLFVSLGQLGDLLQLPSWLRDTSPFAHVPLMPTEEYDPLQSAALFGVAGAVVLAGLLIYRRRDIG